MSWSSQHALHALKGQCLLCLCSYYSSHTRESFIAQSPCMATCLTSKNVAATTPCGAGKGATGAATTTSSLAFISEASISPLMPRRSEGTAGAATATAACIVDGSGRGSSANNTLQTTVPTSFAAPSSASNSRRFSSVWFDISVCSNQTQATALDSYKPCAQ